MFAAKNIYAETGRCFLPIKNFNNETKLFNEDIIFRKAKIYQTSVREIQSRLKKTCILRQKVFKNVRWFLKTSNLLVIQIDPATCGPTNRVHNA